MPDLLEMSDDVKYTEKDMLRAFRHGINYSPLPNNEAEEDFDKVEEQCMPFFEWLRAKYKS